MYINSIVEDKNKKFILKTPIVVSIIIVSIVALFTIFGMVDYFRAKNGKRPIFIYHKVNVFNVDVGMEGFESTALPNKEGITYYGVGYTVAVCDTSTQKYTFQLGNKKTEPCYTALSCTTDKNKTTVNDENDKDSYEYTFFDGKLTQVTAISIRSISSIKNVETADAEIRKFYHNIPGCGGKIEKISEEAYKTVIICTIPNMKSEDIDKHLPIKSKELLEYTKEEIIDYHHNDLKCE